MRLEAGEDATISHALQYTACSHSTAHGKGLGWHSVEFITKNWAIGHGMHPPIVVAVRPRLVPEQT
jgi:hypothetical protein